MTIAAIVILSALIGGMSGALVVVWVMECNRRHSKKNYSGGKYI